MSLANPKTITEVFMRHGLRTHLLIRLQMIQELALAISLQGTYAVYLDYHGGANLLRIRVRDAADPGAANNDGNQRQHEMIEILLPRDGQPLPEEVSDQLAGAAETLTGYLAGGDQS